MATPVPARARRQAICQYAADAGSSDMKKKGHRQDRHSRRAEPAGTDSIRKRPGERAYEEQAHKGDDHGVSGLVDGQSHRVHQVERHQEHDGEQSGEKDRGGHDRKGKQTDFEEGRVENGVFHPKFQDGEPQAGQGGDAHQSQRGPGCQAQSRALTTARKKETMLTHIKMAPLQSKVSLRAMSPGPPLRMKCASTAATMPMGMLT